MRCDQPQGLPPAANAFLAEFEIQPICCEACKRPLPRQLEVVGEYAGFNEYSLHRHQLKDGRTADEFLQAVRWSSGPMFFLGLGVLDGPKFIWSEKEIEQVEEAE